MSNDPLTVRSPRIDDHPTVVALRNRPAQPAAAPLTFEEVRTIALAAGADDAASVSLDHPELAGERAHVLAAMPGARSLISIVLGTHRDNIRSPKRSVAN